MSPTASSRAAGGALPTTPGPPAVRSAPPRPDAATARLLALLDAPDEAALLRAAARACTEALDVARCAVYVREPGRTGFVGRASHPSGALEEGVRALRLGGPADEVTRRIVTTGAPLVVRDLQRVPGVATAAMRAWGVTALLAAPLQHGGETLGFLVADHAGRPHPFDAGHLAAAAGIAAVATTVLVRLRRDVLREEELRAERRRRHALAHVVEADERLGAVLLAGGGVQGLVAEAAALTGRAVVLHDEDGHRVAEAAGPGHAAPGEDPVRLFETGDDDLRTLLDGVEPGGSATVPAALAEGRRRRHLVAPVDVGASRWGWVVVPERGTRLSVLDDRALRRVAAHLALELTVQHRTAVAALDVRATLARLLIRGMHHEAEIARCATVLGIALDAPRVVAYVRDPGTSDPVDGEALTASLQADGLGRALTTRGPEGIALMIEIPPEEPPARAVALVRDALVRASETQPGLVVGVSAVCRDARDLPRAYREARDTASCVLRAGGRGRVLAADDLGAARLFVANTDAESLHRFVGDVLGPLLHDRDESADDLLLTLHTLFHCGRNVRHSAVALGVHENTVRYRLARIHAATGLDVAADPQAQLSVQTALLVLRLRDDPALPPFGTPVRRPPPDLPA